MRRSVLFSLVAGVAILAAGCSSDDQRPGPMEPAAVPAPDNQGDIVLRCRNNGLIVVQLAAILPATPPARLYQQAVVKFALVEFALLTKKKPLAQARALDLIDFLIDNRGNLIPRTNPTTAVRLSNVIDAILCIVGLQPAGADLGPNTGIGVVPANNPEEVIIRTPLGTAGLLVPPNFAPDRDVNDNLIPGVVVTVTGNLTTPLTTPLDQYGQTVELTASQEVVWREGGVTVALCVTIQDVIFDNVFSRLRVGHQGGLGPFFGLIEILPQADGDDVNAVVGTCGAVVPFRMGFGGLRSLVEQVLLPAPLHAAVVADKAGGVGGTTKRFSPFRAVDPELELLALPTSTEGTAWAEVAQPPSVLIRTQTLQTPIPGIDVVFAVPDGPGTIDPGLVTTDEDGVAATDSWVLGPGTNTVTATPQTPVDEDTDEPVEEINFTPESVTFTAEGIVFAYRFVGTDVNGTVAVSPSDTAGWTSTGFDAFSSWQTTTSSPLPFGDADQYTGQCSYGSILNPVTAWLPSTRVVAQYQDPDVANGAASGLLLRQGVTVPGNTTTLTINVAIDNDIAVFLNGNPLTEGTPGVTFSRNIGDWGAGSVGGFLIHGGCAAPNSGRFTVDEETGFFTAGEVNLLAVYGRDRGGATYLDVTTSGD